MKISSPFPFLFPFPLLCLCVAGAALAPVGAMSLDEAEAALSNDDFKVREEAEQLLRKAGMDAYDRVDRLTRSDDPEVAARARACLPVLLLGLDDRFPPDLAAKLRRIDDFRGQELEDIVGELTKLDPPRPVTLIGLHSHWLTVRPDGAEATKNLITSLERALTPALSGDTVVAELSPLHAERYQTRTLAVVLNSLCKARPDDVPAAVPLLAGWLKNQPQLPEQLNADGYQLEIARVASAAPNRLDAFGQIFNFATGRKLSPDQQKAVQRAIDAALRRDDILTDLSQLPADRYPEDTLAIILNGLCRQRPDDLTGVMPLYDSWTRTCPKLTESLNSDGYRLELARLANTAPNRIEALRKLLNLGTKSELSPLQQAALRQQLGSYRDDAGAFPVKSLDQDTGWFFFNIFGAAQFDAYREYRTRFPDIDEAALQSQPLEVLMVLDKSGAGAALEYALKQRGHGEAMMLGEWLHTHPELIKEPLPLPDNPAGKTYPYRIVKFFRLFAPYADDAEMKKNPKIAAACDILTKDPGWSEVAKQARAVISEQRPQGR